MTGQDECIQRLPAGILLLVPLLPPDAATRWGMPFLSRFREQATAFPFAPEPLGLTRRRLFAPIDPTPVSLSSFRWGGGGHSRKRRSSRAVSLIPRRRAFRPFRRWIGRRWESFPVGVDPAFVPAASLARLRLEPVLDDEDNLFADLEEEGVDTICSLLDYAWMPGQAGDATWVDPVHEPDYTTWTRVAARSRAHLVVFEFGQRWPGLLAAHETGARRVQRALRRTDRRIRSVLLGRGRRLARIACLLFPERPETVREWVDLERAVQGRHFEPGRDYAAVVHSTFAQVWSLRRESGSLLRETVESLPGVRVVPPGKVSGVAADDGREWGDWIALAERGTVFHPNHFDGRSPRRTAFGWADPPPPEARGLVMFKGDGWRLPVPRPAVADVAFLREVLLETYLPGLE